jgi:hypothetical protein
MYFRPQQLSVKMRIDAGTAGVGQGSPSIGLILKAGVEDHQRDDKTVAVAAEAAESRAIE